METAAYLSPEILRGHEASSRSDIFSFGVLAYELLSGSRPFPGRQIAEVLSQILHEEPVPLRRLWSECPSDLDQVIARCLNKEVDSRYHSCTDVATELERCILNLYGANSPSTHPRPTPLRPKELEDEAWLDLLIERARDLARARELPRALVVLATARGLGRESEELDHQHELLLQRLQRRSRTGVPSDRHQATSDESVDKALTEMRAVLYIGNIEGVEEAIRRHRDDLSAPEVVSRLRKELSTRLAGIRAAIATAAESVVEDGLATAKQLLAQQRLRGASRLLRALRPIASGDDVETTLHVVAASQRHGGEDQRSAEVVASIEQLLNQQRPVEAAAAMRFALRLYGAKANLGSLVDHLAESFRDEVQRLSTDADRLVTRVTDLCESAAVTAAPRTMRILLQCGLELRADDRPLLDLRNQLLRRDGGKPMLLLIESARNAAAKGDPVGALTSLLAAYQLAPENAETLALLERCGAAMLSAADVN
ncbi:MAG: protein kinase [Thermoanaerobaculia bacterium]|nr:protein kinase [Thermoanaerobaculia bacterium]